MEFCYRHSSIADTSLFVLYYLFCPTSTPVAWTSYRAMVIHMSLDLLRARKREKRIVLCTKWEGYGVLD
jgi:hypothetical protein